MKSWLLAFCLSCSTLLWSQPITGRITNVNGDALSFVGVFWQHTQQGVLTTGDGTFSLDPYSTGPQPLVIQYVGYITDTLQAAPGDALEITVLQADLQLPTIEITTRSNNTYLNSADAAKVEVITAGELRKAACCDLAGCFNTTATVQPATTNVLTNAQELRILGLGGVYNQVLMDGLPVIQGLSYTYGVSNIPGPLVGNIFVAKGTTSVLQGYESITGQVNVVPKSADSKERALVNLYLNSFGERQANVLLNQPVGRRKQWNLVSLLHGVLPAGFIDRDNDNLLDVTRIRRGYAYQQWKYRDPNEWGWHSTLSYSLLHESRQGGHPNATADNTDSLWRQLTTQQQATVMGKVGYRFNDDLSWQLMGSLYHIAQDNSVGYTQYNGAQWHGYLNTQVERYWGSSHQLTAGMSIRGFDLSESISFSQNPLNKTYAGDYHRTEVIPGVFIEQTFRWWNDRLTWIVGARLDYHNTFGEQLTPRMMVKADLSENMTLRASAGRGWRTVNLFPEQNYLLTGNRDIQFQETILPESAWNMGINLLQRIEGDNISGYISADIYQVLFNNQFFPDLNTNPTVAIIRNFDGDARSIGAQADLSLTVFQQLQWRISYNWLDVFQRQQDVKVNLPFIHRHKVLTALSWTPKGTNWQFDANAHWYGRQFLPDGSALPAEWQRERITPSYLIVGGQIQYATNKWEWYAGVENLLDFRQLRPVQGWTDPFGRWFDPTSVWGPTRGREIYAGVRFKVSAQR